MRPDWARIWHIAAFLVVLAVLAAASRVLKANSSTATLALIGFGLVYIVSAALMRRPYLGILGLLLSALGLFVCGCRANFNMHWYPLIAAVLASAIAWLVERTSWGESKTVVRWIRFMLHAVSVAVFVYILAERSAFTGEFRVAGVLSPLVLAAFYYVMDIRSGRSIALWPFSILLGTSLLILLYSLKGFPSDYYGPILGALGCYLLARGAARSGLGRRHAILSTHTMGVVLTLMGLFYAIPNLAAVVALLTVCVVGFWMTNRIHRRVREEAKPGLLGVVEGAIPATLTVSLNVTTVILFVLLAFKGLLLGWTAAACAFVVAVVYLAIGMDKFWEVPGNLTKRPYIGVAAVFFSTSYLLLADLGLGAGSESYLAFSSLLVFAVLTTLGLLLSKRSAAAALSLYDAASLVMASALLLLALGNFDLRISAVIVGAGILVITTPAVLLVRKSGSLASVGIGIVYVAFGVSNLYSSAEPVVGYLLMAVSLVIGLFSVMRERDTSLQVGWHGAAVYSIIAGRGYPGELAICLALFAVFYAWNSFRVRSRWYRIGLAAVATISGLASLVYIFTFGLGVNSSITLLLLGAGLLAISFVHRIRVIVPVAGLLLVGAYLLFLHQIFAPGLHLLLVLPTLVLFLILAVRKTKVTAFFSSLRWDALGMLAIVSASLISRSVLSNNVLISLTYLVFFAVFLVIRRVSKEFLYTVLSFLALALCIFFAIGSVLPKDSGPHLLLFGPTALVLVAAGFLTDKKGLVKDARSLYAVAALCALSLAASTVSGNFGPTAYAILTLSTVTYLALLSLWRLELFPYLVTVNLGVIAFAFAKSNLDQFATQLLGIFLSIVAGVGLLLLYPNIRQIMRYSKPGSFLMIKSWRGAVLLSLPAIVFVLLIFLGLFAKLLDVPGFCVTCHYMKPYYDSWKVSTHKNVPCVQCHYEPGLAPKLRGKVDGLIQMGKYVTRTYEPKPSATISDNACLRKGCHDTELIKGPILFKRNIRFDHREHLAGLRRGKKLLCTSCHSQIVQGKHLTVTETVCFLCHFKNRDVTGSSGTEICESCHGEPAKTVQYAGLEFNHVDFIKSKPGVACVDCHVGVTSGEGEVTAERCLTCHSRSEEDLGNPELLHRIHITERKVECFECHNDIRHGRKVMAEPLTRDCRGCHSASQHVGETEVYAGTGGKGLSPSPDPMFLVGVHCSACHKGVETGKSGLKAAVKEACVSCHDVGYGKMMVEWQSSTRRALAEAKSAVKQARGVIQTRSGSPSYAAAESLLAVAVHNVSLVETDGSEGVHNISYTLDLLNVSENLCGDAISMAKTGTVRIRGPVEEKAECAKRCHTTVKDLTIKVGERIFPHGSHIEAGIDCISCHGSEEHGKTRSNARRCVGCHHRKDAKVKCEHCHTDIKSRTVEYDGRQFSHLKHMDLTEFECGDCHAASEAGAMSIEKEVCAQCHEE